MASPELDERGIVITCTSCGQKNRLTYERLAESVRCGRCKQAISAPDTPIEVRTAAEFDRLVARSSLPVVVDYWAPWCGPCRMVAPELQKVASRRSGQILVVKVNTDDRISHFSDAGTTTRRASLPWALSQSPSAASGLDINENDAN